MNDLNRHLLKGLIVGVLAFGPCQPAVLAARVEPICEVLSDAPKPAPIKSVHVVFFPRGYHVELGVGPHLYNPVMGFEIGSLTDLVIRGAKAEQTAIVAFKLAAAPEEYREILDFVESSPNRLQSCISGVCAAINKMTGISIPFPVSHFPTYTALYLAIQKLLGGKNSKIQQIDFIGNPRVLAQGIAKSVAADLAITSIVVLATIAVEHGVVRYLIPLASKM